MNLAEKVNYMNECHFPSGWYRDPLVFPVAYWCLNDHGKVIAIMKLKKLKQR